MVSVGHPSLVQQSPFRAGLVLHKGELAVD